jgi:putative endopeptidase
VVNQESFYSAFEVKEGDKMYVPPKKRIRELHTIEA